MTELFEENVGNGATLVLSHKKSVSAMLWLVSSVRESDIERYLQAENILICGSFAFDHQNYSSYGAFQEVNLQSLRKKDEEWFNELKEKGYSTSLTGDVFPVVYSELATRYLIKRQSAPLVVSAEVLVPIWIH